MNIGADGEESFRSVNERRVVALFVDAADMVVAFSVVVTVSSIDVSHYFAQIGIGADEQMIVVGHDAVSKYSKGIFGVRVFNCPHDLRLVFDGLKDVLSVISPHDYMVVGVWAPVAFSSSHFNDRLSL